MEFEIFVTTGLGDNSYLVWSGDQAMLVDPQRDVWRFLEAARKRGLSIRWVIETHLHNDYLSGARAVQEATGASIGAPASGGYAFAHRGLREGDAIRIGDLNVVALETPGHTPEHLAYLVYDTSLPRSRGKVGVEAGKGTAREALFSGGSLIVGSAGRTDLLGVEKTPQLTRAQFHSLRRFAEFEDDLLVLPTHGAGSFCAATAPSTQRTSTLGDERASNPALRVSDEDQFVDQQLRELLAFPTYYRYMAPINRAGPPVLASCPTLTQLGPAEVDRLVRNGAWIVDARGRLDFANGHIPGALNVELDDTFASYVGWTIPFGSAIALVLPDESASTKVTAVTQLIRVGYDRVAGYLTGGIDAWQSYGHPVARYPVAGIGDLCRAYRTGQPMTILDVRQQREWDRGHIPEKSVHIFVGDLPTRLGELSKDTELWTVCATGHRASTAASLLDRAGLRVRLVAQGGVPDWAAQCSPRAI
jgi:glyoxylase-like metal-dependent hydrolase (beta-lactamase superfamily II)/rhodanese-related sulfurtransferase